MWHSWYEYLQTLKFNHGLAKQYLMLSRPEVETCPQWRRKNHLQKTEE